MLKKALLLGYGGTGRELASWLPQLGFDSCSYLDDRVENSQVIGSIPQWNQFSDYHFFATIGSYRSMNNRKTVLDEIPANFFATAISPLAALFADNDKIGHGSLVFPFSVVSDSAQVGDFCLLYHSSIVSHDCVISCNSIISNGAVLSGSSVVGENSYIGANSTVLEGITIGENCVVAAGSTVIEDIPDNCIYYGPGKVAKNKYIL